MAGGDLDYAVVVTAYGDSPFLRGCLQSLSAQTLKVPLFVATSTPSDFIAGEAERAGATLAVNSVRAAGIAADWNFALRAGKARYVTLAHQDDTYAPRFCEATMAAFARTSVASLCFTGYREIDDDGRPRSSKISIVKGLIETITLGETHSVKGRQLRAYLSLGNPLPCSSVTFDLARLADFAFKGEMSSNLDWQAWLDLCDLGVVFARAPEKLVGRRHNDLTETAKLIKSGKRKAEDLAMFERLWPKPIARLIAGL
ncbi:MAG TPA: glycosyltransferase family A protein, partial [Caulobacteraceae bacterium]|nr:glycosyltransferase family A protein [Caulobacteraceae bacterium]